jgi:aminoglycoside phosphotransferase (APT) family kinase protein
MEYDWERTFPFVKIERSEVSSLFEGILEKNNIINIIPISEGCRTTNYIIETDNFKKKYILKIFFSVELNYKKEIKLLTELKRNQALFIPEIYRITSHESIQNKQYAIYEYIEGKSIGQAISEGYKPHEEFVRDVARFLANIHNYKFDKAGFFDENLIVKEELPPLVSLYKICMGDRAKNRLGKDIVDKINYVVKENEKILSKLDEDIRLVHGDFQGTNILMKDGKLSGVLDWEFAMAGHPLADIGQFFRYEEHFNRDLIEVFEEEYINNSSYKLFNDWYKISKLRDLVNLIQLIDRKEDMPKKYTSIKGIVDNALKEF